jgi:hypothetical protein
MLSRKTSNAIFYAILAAIFLLVLLIRFTSLGALNSRIANVSASNIELQAEIEELEIIVQENKDVASDHLYDLYDRVPETYNEDELSNFTEAQLDLLGINDDPETYRNVDIEEDISFPTGSVFAETTSHFKVVEVEVYFNTTSVAVVDQLIDLLYASEQVFIVNSIEYYSPDTEASIGVTINFLAFYKLETTE